MTLSAPLGRGSDLHDDYGRKPVLDSKVLFEGMIFDVRRDTVDLGEGGGVVERDYIEHPGAVVIVALRPVDGVDHVMMIRQYRHAAGAHLWELPAGILDVDDEPPWQAAARELAEEVDLRAGRWDVLADSFASPGAFPEAVRVFLARDLSDVPDGTGHERTGEEADLRPLWVPLDEAVGAVLAGEVHNSAAVIGVLAAATSRSLGWETLRPHDAPWPAHPSQRA
ncbi:ADP-ribose pyrophosphatase [Intrasporangium chromatireducens Q5-1]|uniref:ADP-ribose pyrophosphatase n=1 Tax=Intrasporangium chromatireducens Q5-1 TaxID=584657 RepID=W9GUR4_9MICO|nr:NUDIX hydrolase [Intrasporangium chromatireducens]EWT07609.1 ADP-ribose pyrophosphatase [Intrasporangium chromatireducens Q5-1]